MKTTSITIRFNNGEIQEGIEALTAFCRQVLGQNSEHTKTPKSGNADNHIADAMLKTWTGHVEVKHEPK